MRLEDLFQANILQDETLLIKEQIFDMSVLAKQTLGSFSVGLAIPEEVKSKRGNHRLLIVPETHIKDVNIKSRKDYVGEMKDVHQAVRETVKSLTPDYTIYMGEIFHGAMKNASDVLYWFGEFLDMSLQTKVLTIKGNHEDSFYKNNPFWYMANGCGLQGYGVFKLVDNLLLDDVGITFHHHNIPAKYKQGKTNIGFMHTDIMNSTLRKYIEDDTEQSFNFVKDMSVGVQHLFPEYDFVFNGHMHKLRKFLKLERPAKPLYLAYTASLGRTNITEVADDFLDRYLYVLDITGDTVEVSIVTVTLPDYDAVIDRKIAMQSKLAYTNAKERKELKLELEMKPREQISEMLRNDPDLHILYKTLDIVSAKELIDTRYELYRRHIES